MKKDKHYITFTPTIENRQARHDYGVEDTIECGISLAGNEVKGIRAGMINLKGSWVDIEGGEAILKNATISKQMLWDNKLSNIPEIRDRKLLLHKSEIRKLGELKKIKGVSLIPLKVYFNDKGKCKVIVGVCTGKNKHDKRESEKIAQMKLEASRFKR